MERRLLVAVGVFACVVAGLAACGAVRSEPSTATARPPVDVPSAGDPLPIDRFVCDDDGDTGASVSCSDGVVLGDVTYGFSCALPREVDLGPIVGVPGSDTRFVEARAVADENPAHVIALVAPSPMELHSMFEEARNPDGCDSPGTMVLAYGGPVATRTAENAKLIGHLACEVPEAPDDPRCDEGGPFEYFLDPSVDGTEGDEYRSIWLEPAIAATNIALNNGSGPRTRLNALDLVELEHDYITQRTVLYDDEVLYRAGVRVVEEAPGRVVVEVLHQSGTEQGSNLVYTTQREEFTYEQLGGGPGWWETRFIVREYSNDNPRSGPDARSLMDNDWAECCARILTDLE